MITPYIVFVSSDSSMLSTRIHAMPLEPSNSQPGVACKSCFFSYCQKVMYALAILLYSGTNKHNRECYSTSYMDCGIASLTCPLHPSADTLPSSPIHRTSSQQKSRLRLEQDPLWIAIPRRLWNEGYARPSYGRNRIQTFLGLVGATPTMPELPLCHRVLAATR